MHDLIHNHCEWIAANHDFRSESQNQRKAPNTVALAEIWREKTDAIRTGKLDRARYYVIKSTLNLKFIILLFLFPWLS
jgi:lipid-binding SYLF domain-containing protein